MTELQPQDIRITSNGVAHRTYHYRTAEMPSKSTSLVPSPPLVAPAATWPNSTPLRSLVTCTPAILNSSKTASASILNLTPTSARLKRCSPNPISAILLTTAIQPTVLFQWSPSGAAIRAWWNTPKRWSMLSIGVVWSIARRSRESVELRRSRLMCQRAPFPSSVSTIRNRVFHQPLSVTI